jgi:O-antigen/teichoic acid export membrane protein
MKSFDKLAMLKNVGSSWSSLGVTIVVGVFLSPYIVHRLGDEAFGIWVLIFSITGYYGLFDLGIRSSVVRYVAKYVATDERDELNGLINTAIFSYGAIGIVALALTIGGAFFLPSLFHISESLRGTARVLFLMVGTALSLGFPLGVFGGILEGLQRFYVVNCVSIVSTVVRASLIVITLRNGGGLLAVALVTVSIPLLAAIVNCTVVLHLLPLRFGIKYADRHSFRRIANYSSTTFVIMVAWRLRFKTDAVVIGTFLSSAAITYFTFGARLIDYAIEVVGGMAQIITPMSSHSSASGDMVQLRKIFVAGNRSCAFIIFPIAAMLFVLGKSIIAVWVGARYVATSYQVLLILLVPSTLMLAQAGSARTLLGMAKHRTIAMVTLMEGIANVILSIILVRRFGVLGDAAGTAIPLLCTTLWFLPRHMCRVLGLSLRTYLREAFLLPLNLTIPLIAALFLLQRWFVAHTYFQLAVQLALGSLVYATGLVWAIWSRRAWNVQGVHRADADTASGSDASVVEADAGGDPF